jgi:transposase
VREARSQWRSQQVHWDARRLVFLDETGLNTKMARLYGRSPVGQRCVAAVPHGHWHSFTLVAALRYDQLSAPFLIDGPMNGEAFLSYVKKELASTLSAGDVVICDNLSSHKVSGVREAIESCGAQLLYLPAYSPDLNPIEMAFAKLKSFLRKAASRTYADLLESTAKALESFTPEHCRNFLTHAQYATK